MSKAGQLVLTRRRYEGLVLIDQAGHEIARVTVLGTDARGRVQLGVKAERSVAIARAEVAGGWQPVPAEADHA